MQVGCKPSPAVIDEDLIALIKAIEARFGSVVYHPEHSAIRHGDHLLAFGQHEIPGKDSFVSTVAIGTLATYCSNALSIWQPDRVVTGIVRLIG